MIRAAEANIARVTHKTIDITGHGTIGNKSKIIQFRDIQRGVRDKSAELNWFGCGYFGTTANACGMSQFG
jgi:hypothetical protein